MPKVKPLFAGLNESMSVGKKIAIGLLIAVAFLAPILFQGFGHLFLVRIFAIIGLYILLALGLNIVVGYAGMLDFGRIAFYAVGAYAAMWVGVPVTKMLGETLGGWSYFIALPAGGFAACLVALILGLPVMRLRGDYLTIVTLGFAEIVRICLANNIFDITNGAKGLPRLGDSLGNPIGLDWLKYNTFFRLGDNFEFTFTSNVYWYFIILILVIFSILIIRNLDNSRLGRSWAAVREDEVAAQAMGVNVSMAKMYAFVLGAFFGGIAGVTFSYFQVYVSPGSFTFLESALVLAIVVIGGMGSIPGVLVGALAIQGIPEFIRGFASAGWFGNLPGEVVSMISSYRYLVFGALMVIMMAFRPQGLIPSVRRARELLSTGSDAVRASSNIEELRDKVGETDYTQP
jgi:branched-chain amino acid transport system permease protein